ncbi:MAG: hypothetical protein ACRDK4_04045 [Solirubrobacteraceae bacterium]
MIYKLPNARVELIFLFVNWRMTYPDKLKFNTGAASWRQYPMLGKLNYAMRHLARQSWGWKEANICGHFRPPPTFRTRGFSL